MAWRGPEHNEWLAEFATALSPGRGPAGRADEPGPCSMADPARIDLVLGRAGFREVSVEAVAEPMWFGTDPEDACRFVLGLLGWMRGDLDEVARARARRALGASTKAHISPDGVTYGSAAWIITARR